MPLTNDDGDNNNFNHILLSYELFKALTNLIKINFNINNSEDNKILLCFDEKSFSPLRLHRIKIEELLERLFTYFKKIL